MARREGRLRAEIAQANQRNALKIEVRDIFCIDRSRRTTGRCDAFMPQRVGKHPRCDSVDLPLAADADHRFARRDRLCIRRILIGQFVEQIIHTADDPKAVLRRGNVGVILARETEHLQADIVVECKFRVLFDFRFSDLDHLVDIARDQSLINAGRHIQCRLRTKQHMEKLQLWQMAADDKQAYCQRRREDQSDRPPESRPERRCGDQRNCREPRARTVKQRLDDVVAHKFQKDDQRQGPQDHGPARIDSECQRKREYRRDRRTDIRNEPHRRGDAAPQQRTRHADEPQTQRQRRAVAHVHEKLHQQIFADARAGFVQRVRRTIQIASEDTQEAVAYIAAIEQRQENENKDDARRRQRLRRTGEPGHRLFHGAFGGWRHLDTLHVRGGGRLRCRRIDFGLDRSERFQHPVEHARRLQRVAQCRQLSADGRLVGGKLLAERAYLST